MNDSKQTSEIENCVSIVMISLNEALAIKKVVEDIQRVLPNAEIVLIDSSTDNTATIAEQLGCVVVRQLPPQGYGNAMDLAFKTASRDIIITMDCDDTYPVESMITLLQQIQLGYDLVSGSRLYSRPKNMPFTNYLANRLFAYLAWMICGVRSTDVHTGMRAYRKSMLNALPYFSAASALPVELQVAPAALGYRCSEIPIDYRLRIGESKLSRMDSTIWTMKRLWRWRYFCNPGLGKSKRQYHF